MTAGLRLNTQRKTILVVEDNLDILALTRVFLEDAGYAVVTAGDGEEGLRVYIQHQSSIALLLTDVTMPHMNGLDLADRVLQSDSQLPVLFMSGDEPTTHRSCGCLTKPFRPTELVGRVGQALNASDKQREKPH